jgi:predicted Mrr-cat superfamily restriction endonuclease
MHVWRLIITHHSDPEPMLRWVKNTGRLAIGWGNIGNINKNRYFSPQDISDAIKLNYPRLNNAGHGGASLYHFCYNVQRGDLVIINKSGKRYLVMEVEGDYEFNSTSEKPPSADYHHQRKASVLPIDADKLWQVAGAAHISGQNLYWTFCTCQKSINESMKAELVG